MKRIRDSDSTDLRIALHTNDNMHLLSGMDLSIDNDAMFADLIWNGQVGVFGGLFPFYPSSKSCQHLLRQQPEDFWRLANQTWDLVLTDSFFAPCGYAIALNNRKPPVIMHATDLENVFAYYSAFGRFVLSLIVCYKSRQIPGFMSTHL